MRRAQGNRPGRQLSPMRSLQFVAKENVVFRGIQGDLDPVLLAAINIFFSLSLFFFLSAHSLWAGKKHATSYKVRLMDCGNVFMEARYHAHVWARTPSRKNVWKLNLNTRCQVDLAFTVISIFYGRTPPSPRRLCPIRHFVTFWENQNPSIPPDKPYHNFGALNSFARRSWTTWNPPIHGFWGSKIAKGLVRCSVYFKYYYWKHVIKADFQTAWHLQAEPKSVKNW